ncbi:hypothetical protein [Clostridium sp. 'White wine YQ']|uniref:hypothetical protein n=1 Tax=Clostridium sp. 'White wine YQ' TaxID=3027474 RepID=UPI0023653A4F|nr:hypothetical protein [Clostridium sp. 'White wine YQ']MDD7795551.1 hypothetical protein [Clostridium sp. 'White wine YQ']
MEKNKLYFSKVWIKSLLILIPIVCILSFGIIKNITNGNAQGGILIIIIIVISVVLIYFIRNKGKENISKRFQNETSAELLQYYDKIYSNLAPTLKDKDAMLIYSKCVVCCYYGEFDKVEQMLNEINWSFRISYIQSLEISIKALICYLQTENYNEGIRLSILSKQLGSVSDNVPGGNKTQNFYETYIQIGELLNGSIDNNIIESLEGKYKESPILIKPLIAYCLSKTYMKMNMKEKAGEKIQYCKQVMPNCKPLFN